ncbi:MAG: hypothetical protein SFT91_00295 [Rickettsiaceae bacterium]|nr:hypothetical protein [Rickettsiaceae bacterium]
MKDDYKKITLTGKVYLKYEYEEGSEIKGDLRLVLHNDATTTFPGDYEYSKLSGYFKGEVFDGKFWQLMHLDEFLDTRDYKFAKNQRPIDTAILCQDLLSQNARDIEVFRSYRGHYTREEYIPEIRITKASRKRNTRKTKKLQNSIDYK